MSSSGRNHDLGSASIPRGNYPFGTSNPSRIKNMGGPTISSRSQGASSSSDYSFSHMLFPFSTTLDLPDMSHMKNFPISHDPSWPIIAAKLPSNMLQFDGKRGEDHSTDIMTYPLWCSSKSLMDDSIMLHLF
jgi:hypothetical protein